MLFAPSARELVLQRTTQLAPAWQKKAVTVCEAKLRSRSRSPRVASTAKIKLTKNDMHKKNSASVNSVHLRT